MYIYAVVRGKISFVRAGSIVIEGAREKVGILCGILAATPSELTVCCFAVAVVYTCIKLS